MKSNITKEQKLNLYHRALECIYEYMYTRCGLCYLLAHVCKEQNIDVNMYYYLDMEVQEDVFIKANLEGFEEITDQMIGREGYTGVTWFPPGDWESRKSILLNAIKTLENGNIQ